MLSIFMPAKELRNMVEDLGTCSRVYIQFGQGTVKPRAGLQPM